MQMIKYIIMAFGAFSSGMVIAGGLVALISIIGVVPRIAEKTGTQGNIRLYETAIAVGGIVGTLIMFLNIRLPFGIVGGALFSLFMGIFYGQLSIALAEMLNVFPVFMRRTGLKNGLSLLISAIALGKAFGSLLYFLVSGFYKGF